MPFLILVYPEDVAEGGAGRGAEAGKDLCIFLISCKAHWREVLLECRSSKCSYWFFVSSEGGAVGETEEVTVFFVMRFRRSGREVFLECFSLNVLAKSSCILRVSR